MTFCHFAEGAVEEEVVAVEEEEGGPEEDEAALLWSLLSTNFFRWSIFEPTDCTRAFRSHIL